jgi:transmembrane sensor
MDEEIKALLVKYITGNADAKERQFVRQWIDESQDNADYFAGLKAAWDDALYHPGKRVVNTGQAFDKLRKRLIPADETLLFSEPVAPIRRLPVRKIAVAAVILLLIGSAGLYVGLRSRSRPTPQTAFNIFVPNGRMKKILLPDSTEVWLNAGTRLTYAADFGEHTREVSLEGQGYFSVKHVAGIPFVVKAHGYEVRDIGTVFTISAYPDNKSFQTAVIEGEVEVSGQHLSSGHEGKVLLSRNEVLSIGGPARQKEQTTTDSPAKSIGPSIGRQLVPEISPQIISVPEMDQYAGWKDQLLVFDEETFEEVARRLERTFDVKIRITNSRLAGLRYSGRFNKVQNITDALRIIKETTPIIYELQKDTIIISTGKN